jgi:hypothetical protein
MPIPAEELPFRRPIPALQVQCLQTEQAFRLRTGQAPVSSEAGLYHSQAASERPTGCNSQQAQSSKNKIPTPRIHVLDNVTRPI